MRIPHLVEWLKLGTPDIVLLQELKCINDQFPRSDIEDLGYNVAVVGQKTYNGVAILSKDPIEVEHTCLPGDSSDEQARYVEAVTGEVRVASIYLPNGNPVPSDKFSYKLAWMDRLIVHAKTLLAYEQSLVLGGDFNVCLTDDDVYDPQGFSDDALCRPESRTRLRSMYHLGFTDAFRVFNQGPGFYSYWDYQAGRWNKDEGLRIDLLFLSPQAADRLVASGIDKEPRGLNKPSDHTPVWCDLSHS